MTQPLRQRWESLKERSPVVGAILTLVSGTAAGQVITFALQVLIARVYSDVDKGLFGIYGSITGFVITFAALRFDLTVILPKDDLSARVLARLSWRCILVSALLTSFVCVLGATLLRDHYHHSDTLMWWLMGSGLTVFLVAQIANVQYWLTRKGRFGDIARNRVLQSTAVAGSQLLVGLVMHGGLPAIVLGTILGQAVTLISLERRVPELRAPLGPEAPTMREMAVRYYRMPLLNGPNVLVDAVRNNGINLVIGAVSVAALGQFQLAWNIMQVPVALIAGSVAQVFLKKLSDAPRGTMLPLVRAVLWRAVLVSIVPFALLYVVAPWLFPLVFGTTWDEAGYYARALTPWLFMNVLTSPVSNIFVVTEQQSRLLAFAVVYCVVPLTWLWLSPLEIMPTITVLGVLMALMLGGMLVMAVLTARSYDREPGARG
ncbi:MULTISPECIES: polysaccharide biosynthesis protein [unclassified Actinomyces]|uniref:lipopolysaccharide biosynthesis protein n=1 Tax=unclassified Actinomyces TaxID=2609248 RepID=UPI002016C138|nr:MULTISPECIES: polysaccharide biosynthesis protein [unclassified Actinomyces]